MTSVVLKTRTVQGLSFHVNWFVLFRVTNSNGLCVCARARVLVCVRVRVRVCVCVCVCVSE